MSYRLALSFLMAVIVSATSPAGELSPPAGPVAETGRFGPRTEVNAANTPGDADSMFKITEPGSYYFAQNIDASPGEHGIEIATGGVTLDLGGFKLTGSGGSLDGIHISGGLPVNIVIMNGQLDSWGQDGIDASAALGVRIEQMNVLLCTGAGIRSSINGLVESCTVSFNSGAGIQCTGPNCVIRFCSAYENVGSGIILGDAGTISDCAAFGNGGNGVSIGVGSQADGCSARDNDGSGFGLSNGAVISGCAARANGVDGITGFGGNIISGCALSQNTGDGIRVTSGCLVLENVCDSNGDGGVGAGIHVTNVANRIDGNDCKGNDTGIDVDGESNIIIRNTASINTANYAVNPGNAAGPIINTIGLTITTTNPWANFSY